MSDLDWQRISAIVEHGHGVASGSSAHSPYPRGTIAMQAPYFQALGLDLTDYIQATLNISISPSTFQLLNPELTFRQVEWTVSTPARRLFIFSLPNLISRLNLPQLDLLPSPRD